MDCRSIASVKVGRKGTADMSLQVRPCKRKRLRRKSTVQAVNGTRSGDAWIRQRWRRPLGQTSRALTALNVFTWECVSIEVATSISSSRRGACVLERVIAGWRAPRIRVDNGPELISEYRR
jgi:hypothetical protein